MGLKNSKNKHRSARNKGLNFERKIAELFREIFPGAQRQLEFQIDDAKGVDLKNTGRYRVQCKKLANYVSVATIEEIQISKLEKECGYVPVLITAGDNKEPMAVLPLDDLLNLIKTHERLFPQCD